MGREEREVEDEEDKAILSTIVGEGERGETIFKVNRVRKMRIKKF